MKEVVMFALKGCSFFGIVIGGTYSIWMLTYFAGCAFSALMRRMFPKRQMIKYITVPVLVSETDFEFSNLKEEFENWEDEK